MLNLLGVIIAFAIIIILIRKKFSFGISLILGSLIVAIFSIQETTIENIFKAFIEGTIYSYREPTKNIIVYSNDQYTVGINTTIIELALLMTLIFVLAKIMQESGAIKKLIESLRTIFSKGGILGIIPAVYGLMPVPGGALFSAPMIDEEGEKYKLNKNQKNFLNVWFRHIWFPIYPISMAMITLIALTNTYLVENHLDLNIEISFLIIANIPAFLGSILIGYYFLRKYVKKISKPVKKPIKEYSGLIFILPPIVPLIFYIILMNFGVSETRSFLIGIIFSIILLYYLLKIEKDEYINLIKKSFSLKLALAIFGIMIFREIIEASGASNEIANILQSMSIPGIALVIITPLILGALTGYNLGAIALSFPIVSSFFPSPINIVVLVAYISLIFISSLVGYLISPIHLCNVLSSDYLKTDTTRMYNMFIPAVLALLVVQIIVISFVIIAFG